MAAITAAPAAASCATPGQRRGGDPRLGRPAPRTGELIVYVGGLGAPGRRPFESIPTEELYEACAAVREIMSGEHAVGRVIARPFQGAPGPFSRTRGRRDFSVAPPGRSYLEETRDAGVPVHGVGKVGQLFAGVGIDESHPGAVNAEAIAATTRSWASSRRGSCSSTSSRPTRSTATARTSRGSTARCGRSTPRWRVAGVLDSEDLLVLTADHGCDVTTPGTDHTREHVPVLAGSPATEGAATTGRWPTSARRACAGCRAATPPRLPGTAFVG